MGYDEEIDKFVLVADDFDSIGQLAQAVAELNLHIVKVLTEESE